jgi:hypothetical protein
MKYDIWVFFENFSRKLNCHKIGHKERALCMKTKIHIWSYIAQIFEWKVFRTISKKIETHILCPIALFRKSCRLRDNVEKCWRVGHAKVTIWRMRITCWILKAINTHTGGLIFITFPLQKWQHESASMSRYTYIGCLVLYMTADVTHWYEFLSLRKYTICSIRRTILFVARES